MLKAIKDRLLRDPGSNGGTTPAATLPAATPPAVTPPAATPAKEEPKEIQYYSLPVVEGEPWNVTANELFQLAQLGANSIAEKQKKEVILQNLILNQKMKLLLYGVRFEN